ncbi:MAG: hypothetical protein DLM50_03285 [Candidatus Meridianibacter frigidus]|nr:MAG: hypothetical protein DLM50_03285 [Candidatus Eremiobacteraeota bacterium]
MNARLKSMLPNNPVNPAQAHYQIDTSRLGHNQDPTPPPEVLAHTKYIYRSRGKREDRVIMYVTDAVKHGLFTTCKGWLVRFPSPPGPYGASVANSPVHADRNAGVIVDNPGPRGEAGFMPIIEPDASFLCETGRLEPFPPPAGPGSPRP